MNLERAIESGKTLRTIGFDDAPFDKSKRGGSVGLSGVVCSGTRFEGMVWGSVTRDGDDASDEVLRLLTGSKFLPQLHMAVFDGIAFGGFNVIDLGRLHEELGIACVTVMRNRPDFAAIEAALEHLPGKQRRLALIRSAGEIRAGENVFFQVAGGTADIVRRALSQITLTGHVPEPVRMAHLVGSAIVSGESGRRA